MNWFTIHYEWIVAVVVMPIALLVVKRLLDGRGASSKAWEKGAPSMPTGPVGTQIVGEIHAREVHFSPSINAPSPVVAVAPVRPAGNIQYISAGTVSVEEVIGGLLYEKGSLNNGIVIRFANEPSTGNSKVTVRAVCRYSLGDREICEVSGMWLSSAADVEEFHQMEGVTHSLLLYSAKGNLPHLTSNAYRLTGGRFCKGNLSRSRIFKGGAFLFGC